MPARQRDALLVASLSLPPAIVLGVVALLGGTVLAVVVVVVVAAGLAAWIVRGADARVAQAFAGTRADPRAQARALNLLEGLGFTAGLRSPDLVVVAEPGANLAAWGRTRATSVVAVTTGLLDTLDRMQLEGVLAAALAEIRGGELGTATLVASVPGLGRRLVRSAPGRDEATDAAAVGLTRFPPGLASALDAIAVAGSAATAGGPDRAHLWLVDPSSPGTASTGRAGAAHRAEVLREL